MPWSGWFGFGPSKPNLGIDNQNNVSNQMTLNPHKNFLLIVLVLYFLSGLSSLAYEILWVRMLSLQFGVSIFGVVITVAVFMFGLGAGSLIGSRFLVSIKKPLQLFALLELAVAAISLFIPLLFHWLEDWQLGVVKQAPLSVWYLWQFIITGLVLLLPALLMGIGFPMILSVFKTHPSSLGTVYAVNTLGAAFGALLPLMLLPAFGWAISLYLVAGVSVFIGLIAGFLSLRFPITSAHVEQNDLPAIPASHIITLLAYAGIGAAALMLEIGWTRLFGMVFLRTEYVLAIILAVFLVGIGFGSYFARFLVRGAWFSLLPVFVAVFVLVSLWVLPFATNLIDPNQFTSLNQALLSQGLVITMLTLPVTLAFGAWMPLLNQRLGYSGVGGARLYGANSIGAALGTIFAGFLLIPTVGTYATIVIAALLTVALSLAWNNNKQYIAAIPLLAIVAIPIYKMVPVNALMPRVYADTDDLYHYEDAVNITHIIAKKNGQRLLLADLQRMDASSDPVSVESQRNQVRLPLLLHPDPRSVLFLGLGTGISASSSLAYPRLERTAVELSRGAITAARNWFRPVNNNVVEQTIVIRDDARRFLMTDAEQYDVIVGDLFHPDLVGRSALLSRQQFQRVKSRLNDQGIFVQWIALNQFELHSLQIILRTFKKVFPESVLFVDAFRMALVGSKEPVQGLAAIQQNLSRLDVSGRQLITGGEGEFSWLGRYWGKVPVDDKGPIQDEWSPEIEFRLPQARFSGEMDLAKLIHYSLQVRPHVSQAAQELNVDEQNFAAFERAYIATELAHRSWLALLQKKYNEGQRLLKLAYQANPKDRWIGFAVADATLSNYEMTQPKGISEKTILESILKIRHDHAEVLKRLWRIAEREGNDDAAKTYKSRFAQLSPLDSSLNYQ